MITPCLISFDFPAPSPGSCRPGGLACLLPTVMSMIVFQKEVPRQGDVTEPECGQSWVPSDLSGSPQLSPTAEDNYLIVDTLGFPVWGHA